ncbi:putative phosphothreonine lyase domain-containing protein [Rhizobium leguminosarum]|uniref:putative phosphothreonine lyase domain-containing protein n=1 Tax=Rhizobium leguminosarum TaxID=384 RepID=UPI003F9D8C94
MLWFPTLSKNSFRSVIAESDERSSGKWLVPIEVPDIAEVWAKIEDAVVEGKLLAAKKSTHHLVRIIGYNLACVYCSESNETTITETLAVLREIGIEGELRYKSDKATFEQSDEYLYSSNDFEGPGLKPF